MPGHLKPLFNRHLLAEALRANSADSSAEQQELVAEWAASVSAGSLRDQTEKSLQGLFLTRIFERVLGYRQIISNADDYHLKSEHSLKSVKSAKTPDACLGFFSPDQEKIFAVIELKAPGADLDGKQGGRYGNLTPVEQAFGYASKLDGCRWVIVCNFHSLRLYRYSNGQSACHIVELADLDQPEKLQQFLFLLGQATLLSASGDSTVDRLSSRSHIEEQRITREFYAFYHETRIDLFDNLRAANPAATDTSTVEHDTTLLEQAQKLLDRVLFICFCEDTGLLPSDVIRQALTAESSGFVSVSRWQQLRGLFNAVDKGHPPLKINGFNGGLFAADPALDALQLADNHLDNVLRLSNYDFESDLNVNILGHIFEQSIADLEVLRAEILGVAPDRKSSKRKQHGVFYTPEFITRYMVRRTIGTWLEARFAALQKQHRPATGRMNQKSEQRLWDDYLETLKSIKVVDPACGSGAFLVAAFDFLHDEYQRVNRRFAELTGAPHQINLLDLDQQILQQNLYGVDLNPESVEISKLSLWLKTARRDKPLNNLDANILCGNSLLTPPGEDADSAEVALFEALPEDSRPFDWHAAFPDVFAAGGFDLVLGNPPYVRQESIGPFKPWLQSHYASYHGVADLYVYFYERGLQLLAPNGKLAYIVTNKWLRAGYGEPLRRFFSEKAVFEEIVDFGHAPIFEDADTFPCIIVCQRATESGAGSDRSTDVQVCPVPRDREQELSLEQYVQQQAYPIPWQRYSAEPWSLEPPEVDTLMAKIRNRGVPLKEFVDEKPYRGVLTGFNEAFLIDDTTRERLLHADPASGELIKPYVRGQDIKRWATEWQGLWMIVLQSSSNKHWPWSDLEDASQAEAVFAQTYPGLHQHMQPHQARLQKRSDKGKFWWELRSCDYYQRFESAKIVYQEIQFHPQYALSTEPLYGNNKVFLLPSNDRYLLACLNSPLLWWFNWRHLPHMKDEALSPAGYRMVDVPIAKPSAKVRREVEQRVDEQIELTSYNRRATTELLTWLQHEFSIDKPGQKLEAFFGLSENEFIAEVKKRRPRAAPRLSPTDISDLQRSFGEYRDPLRDRRATVLRLERELSALINSAYGLSDRDIDLIWKTAPPRMPFRLNEAKA